MDAGGAADAEPRSTVRMTDPASKVSRRKRAAATEAAIRPTTLTIFIPPLEKRTSGRFARLACRLLVSRSHSASHRSGLRAVSEPPRTQASAEARDRIVRGGRARARFEKRTVTNRDPRGPSGAGGATWFGVARPPVRRETAACAPCAGLETRSTRLRRATERRTGAIGQRRSCVQCA
jgi:hypothetical protein